MRFFAVASVMIGHWIAWDVQNKFVKSVPWAHGVFFFFVLSGFLITRILLKDKEKVAKELNTTKKTIFNFYMRRALRIFPLYFGIIFLLRNNRFEGIHETLPWLSTFTTNFLMYKKNALIGPYTHFWSLAVEEQFYLFWPLILIFINMKNFLKASLVILSLSLLSRLYFSSFVTNNWTGELYLTSNVMFALIIGAILSYIFMYKKTIFQKISSNLFLLYGAIILYILIYYLIINGKEHRFYSFLLDEVPFCLISALIIGRGVAGNYKFIAKVILENKVLKHFGEISYGLYVFHLFAPPIFWGYISKWMSLHTDSKYTAWVLYFTFTVLAAEISYYFYEKPINSLKRFFNFFLINNEDIHLTYYQIKKLILK